MNTLKLSVIIVALLVAARSTVFAQGNLTPPGAPGPTMKTLQQVEPRTPVGSLPFPITNAGSYYVTTNLTGITGQNGITISAGDVTLDLNGFTLAGVSGSLDGIRVTLTNAADVAIRNGVVCGWGGSGVNATNCDGAAVEQLRLAGNGGWGLMSGWRGALKDCTAMNNAGGGFNAEYHSVAGGCVSAENGGDGFRCGGGATLRDCLAMNNTGAGFVAGDVSVLSGCTSRDNAGNGFEVGAGCAVNTCSTTANGQDGLVANLACTLAGVTAKNNSGNGLWVDHGCVLSHCVARQNGNTGILAGDGAVIADCSSRENADGILATVSSTVSQCAAAGNGGSGINVGVGSSVKDCTARDNGDRGIAANTGCTISGCSAHYNRIGISVPNDCYVLNNAVYGNNEGGVLAELDNNRIDGNHVTSTSSGWGIQVNSTNNVIIRNTATANAAGNFTNAPGNVVGEILDVHGGTTLTNAGSWANFSF